MCPGSRSQKGPMDGFLADKEGSAWWAENGREVPGLRWGTGCPWWLPFSAASGSSTCARFTTARPEDDTTQFWFRADYLESAGESGARGLVGWYVVKVDTPDHAALVSKAIDDRFANSSWETKADTERAFAAGFVKQMGNIEFLILSIRRGLFTLLLVTQGNTLAMSVRSGRGWRSSRPSDSTTPGSCGSSSGILHSTPCRAESSACWR